MGVKTVDDYPDIIAGVLRDSGRPLTNGEVFRGVTTVRPIKNSSLSMFLRYHPRFYEAESGQFGLRAWLKPRELQTLRIPLSQIETRASFDRVARAERRGIKVEGVVAQDRAAVPASDAG